MDGGTRFAFEAPSAEPVNKSFRENGPKGTKKITAKKGKIVFAAERENGRALRRLRRSLINGCRFDGGSRPERRGSAQLSYRGHARRRR